MIVAISAADAFHYFISSPPRHAFIIFADIFRLIFLFLDACFIYLLSLLLPFIYFLLPLFTPLLITITYWLFSCHWLLSLFKSFHITFYCFILILADIDFSFADAFLCRLWMLLWKCSSPFCSRCWCCLLLFRALLLTITTLSILWSLSDVALPRRCFLSFAYHNYYIMLLLFLSDISLMLSRCWYYISFYCCLFSCCLAMLLSSSSYAAATLRCASFDLWHTYIYIIQIWRRDVLELLFNHAA